MKYSEILKLNKEFENSFESKRYDINILSNIVINQIKEIVEYFLRSEGINAHVDLADYDNIVQDSLKYRDSNAVIVFWELCNIIDGFHYKVELLDESQLDEIFEKIKLEINLVIKHLDKTSLVLINKFSSLSFSNYNIRIKKYDDLATKLNIYLEKKIPSNVRLIDIEKVIANIGISNTLDIRYYYSSKALYTVDLL